MIQIIKLADNASHINQNMYNTDVNLDFYDTLLPKDRIRYLNQMQQLSPIAEARILDRERLKGLRFYAKQIRKVEKEIPGLAQLADVKESGVYSKTKSALNAFKNIPSFMRTRQALYSTRKTLMRKAEKIAGVEPGTFGNSYVNLSDSERYLSSLENTLMTQTNMNKEG